MHEGVAGKGNALTLNNRESVVYSNYKNHNPKQGTISLWIAPKNWSPDKKKFQVFFDSAFPGGCRFLIYKFIQNSLLRFAIILDNKEIGYINVPLKNADWTPGRWHKIDAVWDNTMMALYLDGRPGEADAIHPESAEIQESRLFPRNTGKRLHAAGNEERLFP